MALFALVQARLWAVVPAAALTLGLVGWNVPAASAPKAQSSGPRPPASVPVPRTDPVHLAQITRYVEGAPRPRLLTRSPFEFVRAPHRPAPTRISRLAEFSATRPIPSPAGGDPLPVLAGIAEENGPEGPLRTAVLTDLDGTVRFAVIGQVVATVLRVSAIEPDHVVLVDTQTGRTTQLFLK